MDKTMTRSPEKELVKGKDEKKGWEKKVQQILNFLDSTQMFFLLLSIPFLIIAPY